MLKPVVVLCHFAAALLGITSSPAAVEILPGVKRVLVLGDSITYDGKYVAYLETEVLVHRRLRTMTDAWLTALGHQRPMPPGLPLEQAEAKAAELTEQIRELGKG
jgi:hypothetical protein